MAEAQLSKRALASLKRHDAYVRQRNPRSADALRAELDRVISLLLTQPFMGVRVARSRQSRSQVTRRYRYKIVDRVTSDGIEVLDVLHPRQNASTPR